MRRYLVQIIGVDRSGEVAMKTGETSGYWVTSNKRPPVVRIQRLVSATWYKFIRLVPVWSTNLWGHGDHLVCLFTILLLDKY